MITLEKRSFFLIAFVYLRDTQVFMYDGIGDIVLFGVIEKPFSLVHTLCVYFSNSS